MSEERLEKLCNKMYYDYLEKEEAQEIINYIHLLEEENKQLKIENVNYRYKILSGNSNIAEILRDKEQDIEFDVLKALNTDLDDDVEMG